MSTIAVLTRSIINRGVALSTFFMNLCFASKSKCDNLTASFGGKSLAWSVAIEWAFCPKRTSNKTHHGWEAQMGQQLFQLHCSIE
ncbi:hypothetical protein M9H77_33073 [Catharanthus roseus]|uniref:Uncharacterized protein n=1 Tax=Catharanthus roseus TaxID=4058 RepID=A0ACB9ZI87_CATRO|nr:hypothetical protein M9H77_33073 [Catharanthus roseus]